jgi:hypothetical protein
MRVRLYSDHPFKTRTDGGPKDPFEREALQRLTGNPDTPYWSFEDVDDRPSLRYATARRMEETCVRCHNGHPDSPKKDWKVGDVPGLRGTFLLMTAICGSLLGLSGVVLIVGSRRRRRLALEAQPRDA